MAFFLVTMKSYEYGTREREYRIEATSGGTAAARAFRKAKEEKVFGRHRLSEWHIKVKKI